MRFAAALLLAFPAFAAPPVNSIAITSAAGAQPSRPVTIGRVFAEGEIPACAEAVASGGRYAAPTALITQTDVKNRWRDATHTARVTAASGTARVTLTAPGHGFLDGERVKLAGVGVVPDGEYTVIDAATATFGIVRGAPHGSFTGGGTVTGPAPGSLRFALVSFRADVPARGVLTVAFRNQRDCNNGGSLAPSKMRLDAPLQLKFPDGAATALNARDLLPYAVYWMQGPVATQVILQDLDPELRHDMSGLHPIFAATFYPGTASVKVDVIVENTWTTAVRDRTYTATVPGVFTVGPFLHQAGSRWRKSFWTGTPPGAIHIDHNFPYLIYSRALPNYDLSKSLSSGAIRAEAAEFNAGDRGEIGGGGKLAGFAQWTRDMAAPGGLADRALIPRWYLRYLWSFDRRLLPVFEGNAEAGAHVPVHFRESARGLRYDEVREADAFGRVISVDARPNVSLANLRGLDAGGPVTRGGWSVDQAHQPDPSYVPYLLTGDWYFLEEIYYWAAYNLACGDPAMDIDYGRYGSWGFLHEAFTETRGIAWTWRALGHAAAMAVDGSAEKRYFRQKLANNVAIREGLYGIADGLYYDPSPGSKWHWGSTRVNVWGQPNPLHFVAADVFAEFAMVDKARAKFVVSPWMANYVHIALGHLRELGLPLAKLQETLLLNLLGQLASPEYNPYRVGSYRMPAVSRQTGKYFTSWKDVLAAYAAHDVDYRAYKGWTPDGFPDDPLLAYGLVAYAAAAYLPGIHLGALSGDAAWEWIRRHAANQYLLNDNLLWALAPRGR